MRIPSLDEVAPRLPLWRRLGALWPPLEFQAPILANPGHAPIRSTSQAGYACVDMLKSVFGLRLPFGDADKISVVSAETTFVV